MMTSVLMGNPADFYWGGIGVTARDDAIMGGRYFGSTWQSMTGAYLFGSHYRRPDRTSVVFKNPLLPAGTVIYRWDVAFGYYTGRATPALPLLKREHVYQVAVVAQPDLATGLAIRVLFFRFTGARVGIKIIPGLGGTFKYPADADIYAVELVSTGAKQLTFSRLDITAVSDPADPPSPASREKNWRAERTERKHRLMTVDRFMKGGRLQ